MINEREMNYDEVKTKITKNKTISSIIRFVYNVFGARVAKATLTLRYSYKFIV